jgi:hypothetical protein
MAALQILMQVLTSGLVCGLSGLPANVCCRVAVSLWLCNGDTLSSWSPVLIGHKR